jgi:hypothetical protein
VQLRIDFYSKDEVSVWLDNQGWPPGLTAANGELFLFTWYTLRQFSNFGNHPVSSILAVLLTTYGKETTHQIAEDRYEFPPADIMRFLMDQEGQKIGIDYSTFKQQIMPKLPKLVTYRSGGAKSFVVDIPPYTVKLKGFGILGYQINYYAFHSVIALFGFLAKKHIRSEPFISRLSQVAARCGRGYLAREIPLGNQTTLANLILHEIGAD